MKKSFAIFLLAAVFAMGMLGALAIVPHAHGDDLNHSKHTSCPVYQIGLHGHEALIGVFYTTVFLSLTYFLLLFISKPNSYSFLQTLSARAPPFSSHQNFLFI